VSAVERGSKNNGDSKGQSKNLAEEGKKTAQNE
jgi:hypothetical protein